MSRQTDRPPSPKRIMVFCRQSIKSILQNVLLPVYYRAARRAPVKKGYVIFADLHSSSVPHCMEELLGRVRSAGYEVEEYFFDISALSPFKLWKKLREFMKLYARAEYVFICNYFLPASSCEKRPETTLIQIWHSGGILKKIGLSTPDDVLPSYIGDPFKNFDYVITSSESCRPVWSEAMGLPEEKFLAFGMPRTDIYFSDEYRRKCREDFAAMYPESAGKKIALWAPTFRGKPNDPYIVGREAIAELALSLGDGWFVVTSAHPALRKKYPGLVAAVPTEELLPAADILITDYSSIVFDWLLYKKPFVIFAPDLEEFEKTRGLYIDSRSMPTTVVTDGADLCGAVLGEYANRTAGDLRGFAEYQIGACDGHACDRILALMQTVSKENGAEKEEAFAGSK
ncbi:MAG: CDP-glycerol glycerophosphotransferase family protein [Clostridiales bacterium]|nr:CDP-glycerol glycerophosphotransferase family protein [Clostridiales bacterium]